MSLRLNWLKPMDGRPSGGGTSRLAVAALIAFILTAGGTGVGLAADPVTDANGNTVTNTNTKIKDINANITGKNNTVTDSSNAEIVGDNNTVTNIMEGRSDTVRSNDARIHGSGNVISGSRNQQVIGDNNKILGRDKGTVTDYGHPEGREENVSDLTIGRGNVLQGNDTYRNEWDSLKVIGNNNKADWGYDAYHAGGPSAGIVIGDNQNLDDIHDSIVIGSLAPSEQQEKRKDNDDLYTAGSNNIIIGYHTTNTQSGGIVIGNRSQGNGLYQTITGPRSIVGSSTGDPDSGAGTLSAIYGAFNKIEDAGGSSDRDIDGLGNSINGSLNVTSNARGTMIMGVGNTVSHAKGPDITGKDEDTAGATDYWLNSGLFGNDYYAQGADTVDGGNTLNISYDDTRDAWQHYMATSGGAVSVLGNSNSADYAIRSQILGTGNILQGSETNMSAYNTVSGFANTGTNVKRTAIVGTGNTLKNSEDNVVIGDYHNLENGKHNVILGSMASEEQQVTKKSKSVWATTDEHPDGTFEYTVTEQVPVKNNTSNIENAVMLGYNTDVQKNGGLALGAYSVAAIDKDEVGYDPSDGDHSTDITGVWKSTAAAVSIGDASNKFTRQITNLAAGTADTDAVNVAQLKAVASKVGLAMKLVAGDGISIVNKDGTYTISANIKGGSTPTDDVTVKPETPATGGEKTTDTPVTPADPGNTDNPSNGNGLIVTAETKPTKFGADSGEATSVKPGETLTIKGDTTNITTTASDHGIAVSLNKDIAVDSVTAGDTKMTSDGLTITGGPSVTRSGIDACGKKVTHVADGTVSSSSTDAVNGSQLYGVKQDITNVDNRVTNLAGDVTNLSGRVSNLDNRINKVGAGAAALAALHPLDFDPGDKWNFAVGYGNYRNANSVAVGAFYRPNEDTMFNVATNFGNGENMINAGVSFKVGKGSSYAGVSKAQLVAENQQLKENDALQDQKIQKQDQEIQELKKALEELKSRIK